jgi:hypothetical protein
MAGWFKVCTKHGGPSGSGRTANQRRPGARISSLYDNSANFASGQAWGGEKWTYRRPARGCHLYFSALGIMMPGGVHASQNISSPTFSITAVTATATA